MWSETHTVYEKSNVSLGRDKRMGTFDTRSLIFEPVIGVRPHSLYPSP